jgi:hypothetical protein
VATSSQLEAFASAREPKTMALIRGSEHFDLYFGNKFEENISKASSCEEVATVASFSATTIRSGVGEIRWMNARGSKIEMLKTDT